MNAVANDIRPAVRVDEELRAHLVPLRDEELAKLEEALLEDGIRTPLVLWGDVLVDGHNRYALALKHDLDFDIESREFADRDAVLDWMDREQIGRRNVTPDQLRLLIGRLYNRRKSQGTRTDLTSRQSDGKSHAAAEVATESGVSPRTVERAGKDAAAIDAAEPEVAAAVMSGALPIRDAVAVAEMEPDDQRVIATAENPKAAVKEHNHRAQGTGENEWYTPEQYVEAAREVMGGIDLDPASSEIANERVQAGRYFTLADNGLEQEWGGRVWLNPPYAQPAIWDFADKAAGSDVEAMIVLTHNYTDTRWFHRLAERASAICFTRGRIGFLSPEGKKAAPTQGQAFFYIGDDVDKFRGVFTAFGLVVSL